MTWDAYFLDTRYLGDGRAVWIYRLMFTHAICIGKVNATVYDDRWCYDTYAKAKAALDRWDPFMQDEPSGWHRNPSTGRRRPDGDEAREYTNL